MDLPHIYYSIWGFSEVLYHDYTSWPVNTDNQQATLCKVFIKIPCALIYPVLW